MQMAGFGKRNIVQGLNDVGAMIWNGHHLDVVAQHVLKKRIIIDMTLVRVNDKKMSSIHQPIPFQERTNQIAYSWNLDFVMYPLVVAATLALVDW